MAILRWDLQLRAIKQREPHSQFSCTGVEHGSPLCRCGATDAGQINYEGHYNPAHEMFQDKAASSHEFTSDAKRVCIKTFGLKRHAFIFRR